MADIALLNEDAFSLSSLTAVINDTPHVPSRLGDLGVFDEEGISTTIVQIEKDGDTIALVPAGVRGQPGTVVTADKRNMIPFNTHHLPQRATIGADEIQGVRGFGGTSDLQALEAVIARRLAKMRRSIDATLEWQRMGALKGQILDADGTTVLLDIFQRFGIAQQTLDFELDVPATELRLKCDDLLSMIEDALGSLGFSGVRVMCGKNFWRRLIVHKAVKETFLNTQMAASLRGDTRETLEFGGCVFERYRGKVSGQAFVGDDEAYAFPEGTPDLLIARYAPADTIETVNTTGLPYYAMQEPLEMKKGIKLEAQSNPLIICARPRASIKLTV